MNAAETIAAAIEKLEVWREPDRPWFFKRYKDMGFYSFPGYLSRVAANYPDDVDQIVTLHRTIDAQLAILRYNLRLMEEIDAGLLPSVGVLDLARAILGESS